MVKSEKCPLERMQSSPTFHDAGSCVAHRVRNVLLSDASVDAYARDTLWHMTVTKVESPTYR